MNIVKLQNDLKDLSDQQLLGSMQSGSAPQYLVLAEMQRRKKMRDEASTPNEPQAQGTVADDIMGGIAAIPMGSMDMASGGLVSFAKGGYAKGELDACWTNPETGEKMCPPAKPSVEYPKTGQRKDMAGGGIVALQGGGTPSEARALLANMGVDTAGMSDEEVMTLAATYAEVPVPNVDVAEPSPTGFAPVPATEAPLPPAPMAKPEAAPPAQSGFMDTLTGGISNLLGIGEAKAEGAVPAPIAEEPPQPRVEYPVPTTAQLEDPIQARQWLGENAPAWYDPKGRSDAQVVEDIKAYAPGGYREGQKQRDAASEAEREARVNPPAQAPAPQSNLPRVSPEGGGVYAQSAARAEDPAEKARLMGIDEAYQRAVPVPGHEGWRYDGETGQYFNPEGRLESGPVKGFKGTTRGRFETREDAKGADARQQKVDAAQATINDYIKNQDVEATKASDALLDLYNDIMSERKGGDAKDRSMNEALMRMGFSMMSSKNPDFFGALGEGGIEGLKAYSEGQKAEAERRKALTGEAVELLAARERSVSGAVTAAVSQAESIRKRIDDLTEKYGPLSGASPQEQAAAAKAIAQLEKQYNSLLGMQGAITGGSGLPPGYQNIAFK